MQEINKMEELKNCTFVKTVLMVVIVILHSVAFWRGDWFTIIQPGQDFAPFKLLAEWIATFPVYGFALVSGYLFYYVKYEREGYTQFGSFLKKKFNRLLVPYIFISAVWAVPIGCFFFHYNRKDIINDYILGKSPNQLWFLLMLFWALLFMFFLSDVIKKNVVFAIGVAAVFYVLSIAVRHFGGVLPNINRMCLRPVSDHRLYDKTISAKTVNTYSSFCMGYC